MARGSIRTICSICKEKLEVVKPPKPEFKNLMKPIRFCRHCDKIEPKKERKVWP